MALYRYIAYSATGRARLAELPLRDVTYGRVLNGAGELRASLQLGQPATYFVSSGFGTYGDGTYGSAGTYGGADYVLATATPDQSWLDATEPGRSILVAERDGVIVWAGIIWTRRWTEATWTLELGANELWSYARRRTIRATPSWSGVATDQCVIARSVVAATQTGPGNIGIATGSETSTTTRTVTVNGYERRVAADVVEDLARMDGGLDFTVDAAYSTTGVPTFTFRVGTPLGRSTVAAALTFEHGRNVTAFTWPEDGTKATNVVDGIGAGEGPAQLIAPAVRSDLWAAGFPQLDGVLSAKQLTDQAALQAAATAQVNTWATAAALPEVTVRGDLDPVVGTWICGDSCTLRIPAGISPRFPAGYSGVWRIAAWTCSPGNEGQETVTLTLAPPL